MSPLWHIQNSLHSSSARSPGRSPSIRRARGTKCQHPQWQLMRVPGALEQWEIPLPVVSPTAVVLPLPGLVGAGSLANWVNRRGLKKENVKRQFQDERTEPVEAASYKLGRINAKETLVLTPNPVICLVVDVCSQKKSLTLKILHSPSPVAFVLTDPLLF